MQIDDVFPHFEVFVPQTSLLLLPLHITWTHSQQPKITIINMSASRNADSTSNQGEFKSKVPRDEPQTIHGVSLKNLVSTIILIPQHQPGVLVGNDAKPTFSAQTLPAGTAPADRTFEPNATSEVPSQADNPYAEETTPASATLGGATSADVHTGLGHPGSGQTSTELRHEGQHTSKNVGGHGAGLAGVGASGVPSGNQMSD